jgi:hypothetical protein
MLDTPPQASPGTLGCVEHHLHLLPNLAQSTSHHIIPMLPCSMHSPLTRSYCSPYSWSPQICRPAQPPQLSVAWPQSRRCRCQCCCDPRMGQPKTCRALETRRDLVRFCRRCPRKELQNVSCLGADLELCRSASCPARRRIRRCCPQACQQHHCTQGPSRRMG